MPHLDAQALIDDPEGMKFLASVLDVPADHPMPAPLAERAVAAVGTIAVKLKVRRRRKRVNFVPAAA